MAAPSVSPAACVAAWDKCCSRSVCLQLRQHGAGEEGRGLTAPSCLCLSLAPAVQWGQECCGGDRWLSMCLSQTLLSWEARPALEHTRVTSAAQMFLAVATQPPLSPAAFLKSQLPPAPA